MGDEWFEKKAELISNAIEEFNELAEQAGNVDVIVAFRMSEAERDDFMQGIMDALDVVNTELEDEDETGDDKE